MNKHNFLISIFTLSLCFLANCLYADEESSPPTTENDPSWWEKSVKVVGEAIDDSKSLFSSESTTSEFGKLWEDVQPTLNDILVLEDRHESLPDNAWIGMDKTENQSEINLLLDEAVSILGISETAKIRQHINKYEEKIHIAKLTIAEYRQARLSAPQNTTWKNTWQTTVAEYNEKINEEQTRIQTYQTEIAQLKQNFGEQLSKIGLQLTSEQLDLLLSSVIGDEIIQGSIVYDNVKQVNQKLMDLIKETGEDITIAKRYYGLHMVLLNILNHMQHTFIGRIDEAYMPKMKQIVTDTQLLRTETDRLLKNENDDPNRRQHLLANSEAQSLTLQTAELYRKHLQSQRAKMVKARNKTREDLEVAKNTYKTVTLSGKLVILLRSNQSSFDTLLNIQTPDLLVFENLQMKQEFAALTKKLMK